MPFWRRDVPIHEKLAREGGLDFPRSIQELGGPLSPEHPFWQVAGIHGVPRAREWDAVASAEAPGLPGEEIEFVALEDGTLVVDEDLPEGVLSPLADALDSTLEAPYHAYAQRREEWVWVVAALLVDVVEVDEELAGDTVSIVVNDGERTAMVAEADHPARIEALERFAEQDFQSYVLQASRIDNRLWEVTVNGL